MTIKLRKKKLSDESYSLYLDIYDKGNRIYEFLDLKLIKASNPADRQANKEALELGNKIRAKREHEMHNEIHGFISSHKANIDFVIYFEKFLEAYNKKDKRVVISALNKFKEFLKEKKGKECLPSKNITESFFQEFRDYLEENHTGATPHNYFSKLKMVVRKAVKEGILRIDFTADIKNPENTSKVKDVLTFEELNILNNTELGNKEIKRAFLFSCLTGLRWCDIKILKWDNIKNSHLNIIQTKTGKPANINLNESALKLLGVRGKSSELIFDLPSSTYANDWLAKWLNKAEIQKKITWHCARHSFGTNILIYNGDILSASKLLGHTSLTYTMRYVRVVEQLKQDA